MFTFVRSYEDENNIFLHEYNYKSMNKDIQICLKL